MWPITTHDSVPDVSFERSVVRDKSAAACYVIEKRLYPLIIKVRTPPIFIDDLTSVRVDDPPLKGPDPCGLVSCVNVQATFLQINRAACLEVSMSHEHG